MNKLWHFGSELSTSCYGESLSQSLKLDYNRIIIDNPTNQAIFLKILEKTTQFIKNDTILVNWVDFRRNDIVVSKNNKAIRKTINNIGESNLNDDYFFYKQQYQNHYHKESFLLFNMIISYFESIFSNDVSVYFLYDTIRNFLIPPSFDITYQLTHNIKQSSFLQYLYNEEHIDIENNLIKNSSEEKVSKFIVDLINGYSHVHSKSFDNSTFPKTKYTINKYTTTDH